MTLTIDLKFKKDTLLKNHFVIHLMVVIFLTQLSKIIVVAVSFYAQLIYGSFDGVFKCLDFDQINFDHYVECFEKQFEWHFALFFSSSLGTLGESVYVIVIMIIKITTQK